MRVQDVLELVCVFLGKDDLLETSYFDGNSEIVETEAQFKELTLMGRCLKLISNEIATDYLPLLMEKQLKITGNQTMLYDIAIDIMEIVSIKDLYGKNVRYRIIDDKVMLSHDVSDVMVVYKRYPQSFGYQGDCEGFGGRISSRILAYGVCMEYSFISSLYEDAAVWEARFKNSLITLNRKKGELKMPRRGWF